VRSRTCAPVLCLLALLAFLVVSAPAVGAPKRITGRLSKGGYTVLALAGDGSATWMRARRGRFGLRPPEARVTLQLRAPDGTYAGSVVAGHEGGHALTGVRAGARLGRIRIRPGYARLLTRVRASWVDAGRWARARKGVPIGNGRNVGLVRSKPPRGAPPGDRDADGVPDRLDVDANGNLILDNLERSRGARATQAGSPGFFIHAGLLAGAIFITVNANAADITPAQVDENLARRGSLKLWFPDIPPGASAELDCGGAIQEPARPQGLRYCSSGGTGTILMGGNPMDIRPFPDCCLDPLTGLGMLQETGAPETMLLFHGATTSEIGTGDVLIERVNAGGIETGLPATVQFVIATHPALAAYDDGHGNAISIRYPVRCGDNNPCDQAGGFPVAAPPGEDVVVSLTFWRPQRGRTDADPGVGQWMDIGHLMYAARWGDRPEWPGCAPDAYSNLGPNLATSPGGGFFGWPGVVDLANDQPSSPENTLRYTLNLSRCLGANGGSFGPGETHYFVFSAGTENGDETTHGVWFTRQP